MVPADSPRAPRGMTAKMTPRAPRGMTAKMTPRAPRGMTCKLSLLLISAMILNHKTYAQYMPTDWRSYEASAQGDSTTAWSKNGGESIFYNPAGLSLLHNRHSKNFITAARVPLPGQIEANQQMLEQMESNPNQWTKNLLDAAYKNPKKPSYLAAQAYPYIVFGAKNSASFLVGFPARSENTAIFLDSSNTNNATINSINTASGVVAISDSTKLGGFRWGISARPNYRLQYKTDAYDYTGDTSSSAFAKAARNDGVRTTAVALDAGIMMTLSDYWFPTIGASVRNIPTGCIENYINPITYKLEKMCGTVRKGGTESSPNESRIDPTEIRAGVSITPRGHFMKTVINLRLTADVYPIPVKSNDKYYGISGVDSANLFHAGGELFFGSALSRNRFALRGGYMNQNASWGASIDMYFVQVGYSSYVATSAVQDTAGTITKDSERRQLIYLGWQL